VALLIGLALAGGLWFAAIPAVTRVLAQPDHVRLDATLVDLLALLLNIALLSALVVITARRRRSPHRVDEDECR
jgi:hypothetical protein